MRNANPFFFHTPFVRRALFPFGKVAASLAAGLALVGCACRDGHHQHAGHPEVQASERETFNAKPVVNQGGNVVVTPGMQANPLESGEAVRAFQARGIIREIPSGDGGVIIRHEDIPGFMPKMTMEFTVKDAKELAGLAKGDTVTFVVKATEKDSWIEGLKKADPNDPALAPLPADPSAAALLHAGQLKLGEVLPDADLLAEDGRAIKLSEFEGRALAFTFIFTRCPMPEYCPRMNQNFSRARELLQSLSAAPTNWQFLSISFDPEFDKPGVLNRYAYSYRGASEDRWLFASAASGVMDRFAQQLEFRFANEGGSFLHNLRTVVLDPKRRVYRQFEGNRWKPEDLAKAMAEAALAVN